MKTIKFFLLSTICITMLCSCEDILDVKNPNAQDTSHFWKTEADLIDGLDACYRALRFNGEYRRWLHFLYISRADEGYCLSPDPSMISYSNFKIINYRTDAVQFTWLDLYKGIFWANQVMDNAPTIELDATLRKHIAAQAKFLRGVGFFNIAGVYGRGGIILTANAEGTPAIEEQPALYRQALTDFEEAAHDLPVQYESSADLGRITKGAALGMAVKAAAQLHEWNEVKRICEEIFALNIYQLVDNYRDNFREETEFNSESLFEIQFISGPVNGVGQLSHERAKFFGLYADGCSWNDATAGNIIKTDLEKEKTKTGTIDPRLKATLFYYDPVNNNTELFYGKTWTGWGLPTSQDWTNTGQNTTAKVYWKKYTNYDTKIAESHEDNGINLRIVRLADIYLMYAEALNELDHTAAAYEYINKVRERAGVNLPKLENSTVFTGIGNDKDKMRTQIMHERVCELSSEGWRWLDLERWGLLDTSEGISFLKSRDYEFENFVIGKHNRFPIPVRDIQLVDGLEQNPKYE